MKRLIINSIILIFILFASTPLLSQHKLLEDDVRASVEKFGDAFLKADVSILKNMLCENYIHVNGSSGNVINKTDWLKWVESRRILLDTGQLVINSYIINDLQIQLFAEMAVVTGTVKSAGTKKDDSFDSYIRFTNVWIMENGNLRRASFHDSAMTQVK